MWREKHVFSVGLHRVVCIVTHDTGVMLSMTLRSDFRLHTHQVFVTAPGDVIIKKLVSVSDWWLLYKTPI